MLSTSAGTAAAKCGNRFRRFIRKSLLLGWCGLGAILCAEEPENPLQRGLTRGCLFAVYPTRGELWVKCDFGRKNVRNPDVVKLNKSFTQCNVAISKAGDPKPMVESTQPLQEGMTKEFCLKVPALDGTYEIRFVFPTDKEPVVVTRSFERKKFAWEGNTLGITDEVYPPFEPVRVNGKDVSVVQRRYKMNGLGLWDSVVSQEREILAGPMAIRCELADGQAGQVMPGNGRFTLQKPNVAVYEAEATSDAVNIKTVSATEIDGMMRVEMDLLPGTAPKEIRRLWIEIPFKNSEVPLMHAYVDTSQMNHAGWTPPGEGVVWTGKDARRMGKWQNAFCPYVWLGAEERGLAWFAENDKGWITEKGGSDKPIQELVREKDRLLLRVYLVNQSTTITEPHHLVFGLQGSPTKPMMPGWRKTARIMPTTCGCVVPWGGLHCSNKGPWHDDWQIVDKILEARATGKVDQAWFEEYAKKNDLPKVGGTQDWVTYTSAFARRCLSARPTDDHPGYLPVTAYHEEGAASVVVPDFVTFQDEWGVNTFTARDWPDESLFRRGFNANPNAMVTYPRSYQDYAVSYANEWLRRGVGLYWDNTYPKICANTLTSDAYVAADGAIQPCVTIWGLREYSKRVWNLLQHWRINQPYPLVWMKHMTNCEFLPLQTWGTCQLDIELGSAEPFSPEFMRTECTGRQAGNEAWTLYPLYGRDNLRLKEVKPEERSLIDWGMAMVHEARTWCQGGSLRTYVRLDKILEAFGYGNDSIVVGNYWDEKPLAGVNQDNVKWLVLANPQTREVLMVLSSWLADAVKVEVRLNEKALGFAPGRAAIDADNQQPAGELTGGRIQVDMPAPYGVRLIRFTPGATP